MSLSDNQALWFIVGGILLVVFLGSLEQGFLGFGVLGEESFEPYDQLLAGQAITQQKWDIVWSRVSATREGQTKCQPVWDSMEKDPHRFVTSPSPNEILFIGNPCVRQEWKTQDLRLINYKTNWDLYPGGKGERVCFYNQCIEDFSGPSVRTHLRGTLELVWDNYELGHYQLKINENIIEEGTVPEGTPYTIGDGLEADGILETSQAEVLTLSKPRIQRVFGCDLREGEVKTVVLLERSFTIQDLPGWKRFCPDDSQTNIVSGVSADRNRVINTLAQGNLVSVGDNELWIITYIADGTQIGADLSCTVYNQETGECTGGLTGAALLCTPDLETFVEGVGCVSTQEDLIDLDTPEPSVTDTTILWGSALRKEGNTVKTDNTVLLSGDKQFLTTRYVVDTNKCPPREFIQRYPDDPQVLKACLTVYLNNVPFKDGETRMLGEHMSVTLEDLRFWYKDISGGVGESWSAQWEITIRPSAARITSVGVEDKVMKDASGDVVHEYEYNLEAPSTIDFVVKTTEESIGNTEVRRVRETHETQGEYDTIIPLPTDKLGTVKVTITPTLQTNAGGIPLAPTEYAYLVGTDTQGAAPINPQKETSTNLAIVLVVVGAFLFYYWMVKR